MLAFEKQRALIKGAPQYQRHRGTGFAGPLKASPLGEGAQRHRGKTYFNQPRLRKYHMGPSALATISASA